MRKICPNHHYVKIFFVRVSFMVSKQFLDFAADVWKTSLQIMHCCSAYSTSVHGEMFQCVFHFWIIVKEICTINMVARLN